MPGLGQLGQRGPALAGGPDVLALVATDRTGGRRLVGVGILDGTGGADPVGHPVTIRPHRRPRQARGPRPPPCRLLEDRRRRSRLSTVPDPRQRPAVRQRRRAGSPVRDGVARPGPAGVSGERDQVGRGTLDQPIRPAEPAPSPPGARAQRVVGGAERGQGRHLLTDQTVRQIAARVGTGVDRYAGLTGRGESLQPARVQGSDVLRRKRGTCPHPPGRRPRSSPAAPSWAPGRPAARP